MLPTAVNTLAHPCNYIDMGIPGAPSRCQASGSTTHSYYSIPGRSIFKYLDTSVLLKSSGSIYEDFQRIECQTIQRRLEFLVVPMKTELPPTTPLPPLVFMPAESSRTSGPAPTLVPLPVRTPATSESESESEGSKPSSKAPTFPLPKLRLEIRDLNHAGAQNFLEAIIANKALSTSVQSVLSLLYHSPDSPTTTVPPTRSVTLILRPMGGVACKSYCP